MKAEDILEFGACGLEHTLPRLREIFEKSHSIPEGFRLSCFPVLRKLIEEGNLKIAWGFVRCLQYHFDKYNITTPGEGEQYTKMVILYRNDGTVKFAFTNIEGEVKNGIEYTFDELTGNVWWKIHHKGNLRDGLTESFYPSGALRMRVNFKEGVEEGYKEVFYETGEIMQRDFFKDGEEVRDSELYTITGVKTTDTPWSLRRKQCKTGFPKVYYINSKTK
jgi:hypothetical protein